MLQYRLMYILSHLNFIVATDCTGYYKHYTGRYDKTAFDRCFEENTRLMGRVDTCLTYQLVRSEDRTEEDIRTEDGKIITGCQKRRTFHFS